MIPLQVIISKNNIYKYKHTHTHTHNACHAVCFNAQPCALTRVSFSSYVYKYFTTQFNLLAIFIHTFSYFFSSMRARKENYSVFTWRNTFTHVFSYIYLFIYFIICLTLMSVWKKPFNDRQVDEKPCWCDNKFGNKTIQFLSIDR